MIGKGGSRSGQRSASRSSWVHVELAKPRVVQNGSSELGVMIRKKQSHEDVSQYEKVLHTSKSLLRIVRLRARHAFVILRVLWC